MIYGTKFQSTQFSNLNKIPYKDRNKPNDYTNDFLYTEWGSKNIYSSWFKCKDYYSEKKINSFDINSFGYKHDIINSMNDSITKNLYGNFHYFVNINDSFPDKSLINVCLGCATLRNLIIPNDNDNFIDSIEISNDIVNNNQHTTFKYRDFYFVDLIDVFPTRIMTIAIDEEFKAIKKRPAHYEDMKIYYSKTNKIHKILFLEMDEQKKGLML
jgi:hypothetical protein